MLDPFLGQIVMFAGNFAPTGWALCQGQVLPIAQNTALFSLLGTAYGGDGVNTFALPDLRGRLPIHMGQGPGLTPRQAGDAGGQEAVTLTVQQLPTHTHAVICGAGAANSVSPAGSFWATDPGGNTAPYSNTAGAQMASGAIGSAGGNQPHDNVQPFLVINYIIALSGIYTPRS
jgi:microcystin-dependent protein